MSAASVYSRAELDREARAQARAHLQGIGAGRPCGVSWSLRLCDGRAVLVVSYRANTIAAPVTTLHVAI